MDQLYKVTPTEEVTRGTVQQPHVAYDFAANIIKIDGIPFAAEFFYFLTSGLNDGDLFEITKRNGAISLRKVELEKPRYCGVSAVLG